jgi:hypothetical protein
LSISSSSSSSEVGTDMELNSDPRSEFVLSSEFWFPDFPASFWTSAWIFADCLRVETDRRAWAVELVDSDLEPWNVQNQAVENLIKKFRAYCWVLLSNFVLFIQNWNLQGAKLGRLHLFHWILKSWLKLIEFPL